MDTKMSLARQAIKNLELLRAQRDQWDYDLNEAVCDEIEFKDDCQVVEEVEPDPVVVTSLQGLVSGARFDRDSAIRRSALLHWNNSPVKKEKLSRSFSAFESCAFEATPGKQKKVLPVSSADPGQPCIETKHSKSEREIQNYITRHQDYR